MTTATATFADKLQDLLIPQEQHVPQPTVKDVKDAMRGWNAAEIADATASVIYNAVTRRDGSSDDSKARRFTGSKPVALSIGMRRGSRLHTVENQEKLGLAWAGLNAALKIALS